MLNRFRDSFKGAGTYLYPSDDETKLSFRRAITQMTDSLNKNLIEKYAEYDCHNEGKIVRPSLVGKLHPFDLLYSKLVGLDKSSFISERLSLIFSFGHFVEAWVIMSLKRMGYQVEVDVTYNVGGLEGHIDCVVTDDDGIQYAIEVKSASSSYFNRVVKTGVDDSRGYLTQASCYRKMSNLPLLWLFVNKDTCEMLMIPIDDAVPQHIVDDKFNHALTMVKHFEEINSIEDVYYYAQFPPAPTIEKDRYGNYKKDDEGRYRCYVPHDALYPEVYYHIEEGRTAYNKPRNYVVGIKHPDGDLFDDALFEYASESDSIKSQLEVYLADYFKSWMKS